MLTECSWVLAPEQEQAVPSTVMTEISDFQQPCNFLRFEQVLVRPDEGYPCAELIRPDFRFFCNCWNNSDLHLPMCIYHTHKIKEEESFEIEICAMKLQACFFLSLHSRLVTPC